MSYKVFFLCEFGMPRDHHAIFVEIHADGSGQIFQVTGNIQQGMTYESKPWVKPEDSPIFSHKELLGSVPSMDYEQVDVICRRVAVPNKQFDGAKRLHPEEPLRCCQEWTQDAMQALKEAKLI